MEAILGVLKGEPGEPSESSESGEPSEPGEPGEADGPADAVERETADATGAGETV
jgi:hypothetical protein